MSVGIDDGALTVLQNRVFILPRRRANPGVPIADFLANTGNLWVVGKDNRGDMGLGMKSGTSPTLSAVS